MQHAIIQKLEERLNQGIRDEAEVVYLFIEIGKYLEQEENPPYPLLRFYRNWVAHAKINDTRLAGEIAVALDEALISSEAGDATLMTQKVMEVISMEKLRNELREFFTRTGLPKIILDDEQLWRNLLRPLTRVLMDIPVLFTGLERLNSLKFRKDRGSNYIICEINSAGGSGITFIWSQLRLDI